MEPILVKIAQNALFAPKSLFGPKVHFGPKMHLWRKKWFLGQKCDFEQKVHFGTLTNSHTPSHFRLRARSDPKKLKFCSKTTFGPKHAFWGQTRILGAKVLFWRKNAFSRPHVADVYKPNGILTKMEAFFGPKSFFGPKVNFGPQNRFLGPKSEIWPQNASLGPKMHFGDLFAAWPQMLMKQMVSA